MRRRRHVLLRRTLFALALVHTVACEEPRPEGTPWWADASARSDAPEVERGHVPYIAGDYFRTYAPPGTRYLNDHTLVRYEGRWHVYGITHASQGSPHEEREFLHASAPSLLGPWSTHGDALVADPAAREGVLWAPHVIERAPGAFTMFYWSHMPDGFGGLRRADSTDLFVWQRVDVNDPAHWPPGGRDAFVLRDGARWLLYSVDVDAESHGQIVVTESTDLRTWSPKRAVITDPVANFGWGNLESPFVVHHEDGFYYLFLTRTGPAHADYVRTNVFRSRDPVHFEWRAIADLRSHAAEVLRDDAGHWFITSAGWTQEVGEASRGLSIAPLRWAPE